MSPSIDIRRKRLAQLRERTIRFYGGLMKGGGAVGVLASTVAGLVPVLAPFAAVVAVAGGAFSGASFVIRERELRLIEDEEYLLDVESDAARVELDFSGAAAPEKVVATEVAR